MNTMKTKRNVVWYLLLYACTGVFVQGQLTSDDTEKVAEKQQVQKKNTRQVREGRGWGDFFLGATTGELVTALGPPDPGSDKNRYSWAEKHIACLINENDVAYELHFMKGFPHPLSSGIAIGTPALKAMSRYGIPEEVQDRDGGKHYIYHSKGIMIFAKDKHVRSFSIMPPLHKTIETNPVYAPGEIVTNVTDAVTNAPPSATE